MIKSLNVDLTEHSDFGETLKHILFYKEYLETFKEYVKNGAKSFLTNDEYDAINTYIKIFGIPYHFNQFDYVFDKKDKFEYEIEGHCYRCGKPLRIPWKMYRGLCYECNGDIDEKVPRASEPIDVLARCPWSKYVMRDSREILSLR